MKNEPFNREESNMHSRKPFACLFVAVLVTIALSACSNGNGDADRDTSTDTKSDMDSNTGSDTDSDNDSDTNSDTDTDVDSDTVSDTDTDTDTDTDIDSDSDSDTNSGTASDANSVSDTETATDSDTDSDADSDTDRDTGNNTGRDTDSGADTDSDNDTDTYTETTLSRQYPGDQNIGDDPAVLFYDDFEDGWGRWDAPQSDTPYLNMQEGVDAHSGTGYLRSQVTTQDLEITEYISSSSRIGFDRQEEIYWRFYARMPEVAPNPHHWVRVSAGNADWEQSGLANTVPPGDQGFWFDFDISNDDVFNFYVYWHEMRSGRCNDGSAIPGCEGDQGSTYYYGNTFSPPDQQPYPRDTWFCIEMRAKANVPSTNTGELTFWIDDQLVGDYRPGYPNGTWLRDTFHVILSE